ncbi:MAG: strawberry notch family protein, partial [Acidobacteria bacterium]|nr:strawberry notch family protein [Acidobacteriota bacterium]
MQELSRGRTLTAPILRDALTAAFGGTDAAGAWVWKDAYDTAEAAIVLFLKRYGMAMRRQAGAGPGGPAAMLAMLERLASLEPSQTRRSEEQVRLQQFSTPLPLAYAAAQAATIRPGDRVLEPSAGTGMLAVMAHCALRGTATQRLYLNELAPTRAGLLQHLFPNVSVNRNNAENIADYLPGLVPSVVLMNPPFSVSPGVERRRNDAGLRHIRSAFSMLAPGGRLVAITSHSCIPGNPAWQSAFRYLDPPARTLFSMAIDGRAYARHGTSFDTRLTVLDRLESGEDAGDAGSTFDPSATAPNAAALLEAVQSDVPPRRTLAQLPGSPRGKRGFSLKPPPSKAGEHRTASGTRSAAKPEPRPDWGPVAELEYEIPDPTGASSQAGSDDTAATQSLAGPYETWQPATVRIEGARPHPTALVQSAAMAAVAHPRPVYIPKLPVSVVSEGRLSDAQLESVVLAGQAHERRLPAHVRIGDGWETVNRIGPADGKSAHGVPVSTEDGEVLSSPVRFRRGWMLGDGTGCGKGRQVAAVILDRWLRGTRRALWLSASDKLLEDARRDWAALGGAEADVVPLGKIRPADPIPHRQGILLANYAALRSPARQGAQSRLKQIVKWLAGGLDEDNRHAFSGVIVFDEAHAMANAAGSKGSRGDVAPSRQGRAGLRLQNALPDARILYVSATGATTLAGLAYARRLGLWGTDETPFEKRTDFVCAMESGGVAAMEVVARDLKALGLYQARALSYDGVEVELLEHALTDEQRRIYDSYAQAFKIIHAHLEQALQSTGISDEKRTLNRSAKAAAMSAFEGAKQRFFGHLLTSMKCPALIRAVEADRVAGRASVIQLVSTGEALMERRIAEVPTSEWNDLNIDLTPRESILSYLAHAFPVQLQQPFTDEEGNLMSRPVFDDDGNPVLSQEAVAARDTLIEKLAALPPVPAA